MLLFKIAFVLLLGSFVLWCYACGNIVVDKLHGVPRSPTAVSLWRALKWPALVGVLLQIPSTLILYSRADVLDWAFFFAGSLVWFLFRDVGNDDESRKWRKKLKEKVAAQLSRRLVVVPEVT